MKKNRKVMPWILFAASLVLAVGVLTFLRPCGAHEDGSFGCCHWAGHVCAALGFLMALEAFFMALLPDEKTGAGLGLAAAFTAVVTFLVPGVLVQLCMMETMRCQMYMKPAVRVLSVLIAVLAVLSAWPAKAGRNNRQ